MKFTIYNLNLFFGLLMLFFVPALVFAETGTIDSANKYAWGDKCGWINFAPTNGNITITDSAITGYAWNEIYGWINFAPAGGGVVNTTSGVLSGYAWGDKCGWINFSGARINCSGKFTGTASGDNVGTITFDCSGCNVTTNWLPSSGCGGGPPPPPEPYCGDSACNGTETCSTCPSDCGTCLPVCGDDVCNGSETCANCSKDCGSCAPVCGDDTCQSPEDCSTCPGDCGECKPEPYCGDAVCSTDESCQNCPLDCGKCVPVCGDSTCNGTETCSTCPSDCGTCLPVCGDNACNGSETCGNCPTDCGSCSGGGVDIPVSHNKCNAQKQCVSVAGEGSDLCKKDDDCSQKSEIIKIIETPAKIIENATQAIKEQIPEEVKVVTKNIQKVIETPQGSVTTKTISTTGAVVATAQIATAIFLSPLEIFFIFLRLLGIVLTAVGLKKKIKPWGIVYDSVTKQPIDPAYVTLKNIAGKEVSSAITDLDGRYGFLVPPGIYQLTANKTNYLFPSQKLSSMVGDEIYNNLYFGGNIEIKQDGEAIIKNIPMDPLKFDWNEFAKKDKKLMKFYSKLDIALRKIFDVFFIVGFVVAVVAFFAAPYPYNLVILSIYLLLLLLRVVGIKPKAYGRISVLSSGDPLSFAVLRVMAPVTNVEVAHKVADKYGRYYCLVPKGEYYVKIEKKNNDGSYSLIYTSPIINASKKGIIKNNFRI